MIRDCDGIANAMLEADPSELEGIGESPVAVHVRSCEECRKLATTFLHGQHAIEGSLRELSPRRTADEALDLLEQSEGTRRQRINTKSDDTQRSWRVPIQGSETGWKGQPLRRRWLAAAIPLLAAASLLVFLRPDPGIVTEWRDPNPRPARSFVAVDAGRGTGAIVVASARSDFTVVWLYSTPQ